MNKIIIIITLLGAVLRLVNISPYHFYPDVYQNLLVAQNIKAFDSVVGPLGLFGYIFPPFILWTRPIFPFFILALAPFVPDYMTAGHMVAFFAGVLAIPLSYLAIVAIWKNNIAGLGASLLTAASFQHVVWSGNVMTETLGVLLMLVVLYRLAKKQFNMFTGIFLGLLVFTRYEYALLLIPICIWFIVNKSWQPMIYALFTIVFMLWLLFPPITQLLPPASTQVSVTSIPEFLAPTGLYTFMKYDPLVSVLFLFGIVMMIVHKKYIHVAAVLFSMALLYFTYYRSNPHQSRYLVHLLPFLLIGASYGVMHVKKMPIKLGIVALALYQLFLSFYGIKPWNNGDYTRVSYEEQSAKTLNQKLTNKETLLITSFPEPYYYFTKIPTNSVSNNFPYIFLTSSDDQPVTIVLDMGMQDLFPNFASVVEKNFTVAFTYTTDAPYYYAGTRHDSTKPVQVYETTAGELRNSIEKN